MEYISKGDLKGQLLHIKAEYVIPLFGLYVYSSSYRADTYRQNYLLQPR